MGMFGRKIGKALGGIDRFAGRVAGEMTAPTTGIGQLGQALRYGFDEDYAKSYEDQLDNAAKRDLYAAQADYYRNRGEAADAPQQPRLFQRRDGSVIAVDPMTREVTPLDVPDMAPQVGRVFDPQSNTYRLGPQTPGAVVAPGPRGPAAGGGLTPAQVAKYRAEAAAAIARGANPAAVNNRLNQLLGGQ